MKLTRGLHPDEFLRLIQEAEDQGSTHLSEKCSPQPFQLKQPVPNSDRMVPRTFYTTGCEYEAKFLVPYEPSAEVRIYSYDSKRKFGIGGSRIASADKGAGLATVCALDDAMHYWPRFKEAIENGS